MWSGIAGYIKNSNGALELGPSFCTQVHLAPLDSVGSVSALLWEVYRVWALQHLWKYVSRLTGDLAPRVFKSSLRLKASHSYCHQVVSSSSTDDNKRNLLIDIAILFF